MDSEELKADIMALRKLYRLFEVNEDGIQNMTLQNLDERACLLLRNLLDDAAEKLFEQFIKCDQASTSPTQTTRNPNPSHEFTPLHSSTKAIHRNPNVKSGCDKYRRLPGPNPSVPIESDTSRLTHHPPQKCRSHHSRDRRPPQFTEEKRDPYTPVNEPPFYDPRAVKYHYSEYIPSVVGDSDEASRTSPPSPTSISGTNYSSSSNNSSNSDNNSISFEEDGSEISDSESRDRFLRSAGRRSYGLSGSERRQGVVWGRRSRFKVGRSRSRSRSRSSYHTYSGILKRPFGRLRKLRNKLALIFHHHHHHHHHSSVEWGDRAEEAPGQARRRQRPEVKSVVRIEEMAEGRKKGRAVEARKKGGKQRGDFAALVEGLKRHVKRSKTMKKMKKKKMKHPKLEKTNHGSCGEQRWWKRLQRRGGRALEKRMRHELLEGKDENASF